MYDLTRRRGVALQVEQRKQSALQRAHAGQTSGCGVVPLALPARVNDEGLLNASWAMSHNALAIAGVVVGVTVDLLGGEARHI